eukprot:jgi/Psemu1/235608/estExt_Genewise1.C_300209
MEIEEDDEPYWYLLNCVAGLEMDLLRQVRQLAGDGLPQKDVVKFVVPTVTKTRSHGANRMVRETKVKYQGYVFAKLRLTKETYEPIRKMDLCRSWMGTINMKGYKKLPPAPLPLSDEEIESFDLENPKWEIDEQDPAVAQNDSEGNIILDTHENDVKTTYKGLKVEDMIKVTAKNKFNGEDGIVRRLKDEMVLIRFFTYGQTFDEWLDPSDVRKLTDDEILKGLGGPGKPITQQDLDGPREDRDRDGNRPQRRFDSRNSVGAFGGGPSRDRRQDRTERSFRGRDEMSDAKERENWNWYKENEKRNSNRQGGRSYDDGNGVEFRPASESKQRGNRRNDFWAEGDADSQWGRNNKNKNDRRSSNNKSQDEDDWSSFVSQGPSDGKQNRKSSSPSKEETDDFFASLMTDLSKDSSSDNNRGKGRSQQPKEIPASDSDDDFFASLMSEIEDEPSSSASSSSSNFGSSTDDDDDFFASLEREIRGSDETARKTNNNNNKKKKISPAPSAAVSSDEDDFFASLEMELETDLGQSFSDDDSTPMTSSTGAAADEDDFFASLESELSTDLGESNNDVDDDTIEPAAPAAPTPTATAKKTKSAPPQPKASPASAAGGLDTSDLQKRTVAELKVILKDRGLKVSGKKAELIERLASSV